MFNCIKSGFYGVLPSGLFLYGDAFAMPGGEWPDEPLMDPPSYLLLRVVSLSVERPRRIHIRLDTWAQWFDESRGEVVSPSPAYGVIWQPASTLIASPDQWSWLGYKGQEP